MIARGAMEKRRLGRTEIEVSPIGLGVMQFSGGRGISRWMMLDLSQEEMDGIVKTALDSGINWFDTAEMYGGGRSEQGLSNALKAAGKHDDEVVVATKWSPILRTAGNIPRSIEDRLRFLGGYTIDLYMVHQPWGFSSPEAEMDAMADLVEAGGLSPHFDWMLSSEAAGSCKPHPAICEQALRRAGCAAGETLFVGDMLKQDIAGANRAGMRSVLLWHRDDSPPPADGPQPHHVIRQIPEVLGLVG